MIAPYRSDHSRLPHPLSEPKVPQEPRREQGESRLVDPQRPPSHLDEEKRDPQPSLAQGTWGCLKNLQKAGSSAHPAGEGLGARPRRGQEWGRGIILELRAAIT